MAADLDQTPPGDPRSLRLQLTHKLRAEAGRRGVAVDLMRKQYAFAIFLGRLFTDDENSSRWMLLGGNALLIRTGGGRFTQDIDLARHFAWDDPEEVLQELRDHTMGHSTGDPFRFEIPGIRPRRETDAFGYGTSTAEVHVGMYLGSKLFEHFTIDLTSSRHVGGAVERVPLTAVIDHATLQNLPPVPIVPVENHLADKVCAMYESHRNGASNRYRDLADIVRVVRSLTFDAGRFDEVLHHETLRRKMSRPLVLRPPDPSWEAGYPRAAKDFAEFPARLHPLHESLAVASFCLNEVLSRRRTSGWWNPAGQRWESSKPA